MTDKYTELTLTADREGNESVELNQALLNWFVEEIKNIAKEVDLQEEDNRPATTCIESDDDESGDDDEQNERGHVTISFRGPSLVTDANRELLALAAELKRTAERDHHIVLEESSGGVDFDQFLIITISVSH